MRAAPGAVIIHTAEVRTLPGRPMPPPGSAETHRYASPNAGHPFTRPRQPRSPPKLFASSLDRPGRSPPAFVVDMPLHGLEESEVKALVWLPTEFTLGFGYIGRIAIVMIGTIIREICRRSPRLNAIRSRFIDDVADRFDDLQVYLLAVSPDIASLPDPTLMAIGE